MRLPFARRALCTCWQGVGHACARLLLNQRGRSAWASDALLTWAGAADKAELLLRDLNRGESYKFRMRARNINGYATSKGQQTSWQLLATTAPDPPTNLRLLAGSDGVTAITIEWDPAPSGNKLPVFMYRLFKLSIENDLDPGEQGALLSCYLS